MSGPLAPGLTSHWKFADEFLQTCAFSHLSYPLFITRLWWGLFRSSIHDIMIYMMKLCPNRIVQCICKYKMTWSYLSTKLSPWIIINKVDFLVERSRFNILAPSYHTEQFYIRHSSMDIIFYEIVLVSFISSY